MCVQTSYVCGDVLPETPKIVGYRDAYAIPSGAIGAPRKSVLRYSIGCTLPRFNVLRVPAA